MFSQTCVILSVHREGVYPRMQWAEVVCIPACNGARGCGNPPGRPPSSEKATEAGGTYPTGMHSCLSKCLRGAQHCSIKWSTEAFGHA